MDICVVRRVRTCRLNLAQSVGSECGGCWSRGCFFLDWTDVSEWAGESEGGEGLGGWTGEFMYLVSVGVCV